MASCHNPHPLQRWRGKGTWKYQMKSVQSDCSFEVGKTIGKSLESSLVPWTCPWTKVLCFSHVTNSLKVVKFEQLCQVMTTKHHNHIYLGMLGWNVPTKNYSGHFWGWSFFKLPQKGDLDRGFTLAKWVSSVVIHCHMNWKICAFSMCQGVPQILILGVFTHPT